MVWKQILNLMLIVKESKKLLIIIIFIISYVKIKGTSIWQKWRQEFSDEGSKPGPLKLLPPLLELETLDCIYYSPH